ncbi:MAG: TetR family transcriptional regulator [Acidimicrobiia bacterium]
MGPQVETDTSADIVADGHAAGAGRTIPRSQARAALIEAALAQLRDHGPVGVRPHEICRDLHLSKALVNYHFGSREGLVAEAMAIGYERYVDTLWSAAEAAGPDPLDRLMRWINTQIDWTVANAGLAAALNFSTFYARGAAAESEPVRRMQDAGVRNFANLQRLVRAAGAAVRNDGSSPADAVAVGLDAAVIGWATLGFSVWLAGNHLPTQELHVESRIALAREHLRGVVVDMLRG